MKMHHGGQATTRGNNSGVRRQVGFGDRRRWWRGPAARGGGGEGEAHSKMMEGRPRAALTGEAESTVMLLWEPDVAAALRSARADKKQRGGGGESARGAVRG
jgi:hypothetical protein